MEGALCYSDQNHGFLGSLCVVVSMVNRERIVWLDQNFGFGGSFVFWMSLEDTSRSLPLYVKFLGEFVSGGFLFPTVVTMTFWVRLWL